MQTMLSRGLALHFLGVRPGAPRGDPYGPLGTGSYPEVISERPIYIWRDGPT